MLHKRSYQLKLLFNSAFFRVCFSYQSHSISFVYWFIYLLWHWTNKIYTKSRKDNYKSELYGWGAQSYQGVQKGTGGTKRYQGYQKVQRVLKGTEGTKNHGGYQEVPRGTRMYLRALKGAEGYQEVLRGTNSYWGVPEVTRGTKRYQKLPRGTARYRRLPGGTKGYG